jgi:uncharacterized protein
MNRRFFTFQTCAILLTFTVTGISSKVSAQQSLADFFQAIKLDKPQQVRQWLARGMDPKSVDNEGTPAAMVAAREKSYEALSALLADPRIDLNQMGPKDENLSMYLAMNGASTQLEEVIKRGAEVNKTGWTALHYAAAGGHVNAIKVLLEAHAYIDAESENQTTPLMMAARMQHVAAAELLVIEGADPTVRNQAGLSTADYFIRRGEPERAQWMVDKAREFRRKYHTESPK